MISVIYSSFKIIFETDFILSRKSPYTHYIQHGAPAIIDRFHQCCVGNGSKGKQKTNVMSLPFFIGNTPVLHACRNVLKLSFPLLKGFDPYITFYLRCKCATFLGARTHRKEMKRCSEICLLQVQKGTFINSLQL